MKRREFIAGLILIASMRRALTREHAKQYRIAIVVPSAPVTEISETGRTVWRAFFEELRRLGYVEGQNLIVERHSAAGRTEGYAELSREVVRLKPDVIFGVAVATVQNLKAATATIPVVGLVGDPVGYGIVTNLARPGGNVTGVSLDAGIEIWGKRLELLKEATPKLSKVGFLGSRLAWEGTYGKEIRNAADKVGCSVFAPLIEGEFQESEYRRVFGQLAQDGVDGLIVPDLEEHFTYARLIVELTEGALLPTLYPQRYFMQFGGLMSFGVEINDLFRRAAADIDRILKGDNPGEIPFYQATKFELVINLKAAKTLDLTVPASLLLRADEVIE